MPQMKTDLSRAMERTRAKNQPIDPMKSILASKTVWGVAIAAGAKLAGVSVDDAQTFLDHLLTLWPVIIGLIADFSAGVSRIKQSKFDIHILETPAFWLQCLSMCATLATTLGVDADGVKAALEKSIGLIPTITALAGSAFSIYGQWKASKKLK